MDILNEAMQIANDKTLVRDYVNSNKFSQLDKKRAQDMSILLENTQNDLSEVSELLSNIIDKLSNIG